MPRPAQLVLKALRWLLLGLAALLLLATAALLAANWRDDPLRPEIAPLMRFEPPAPEAMRRNR